MDREVSVGGLEIGRRKRLYFELNDGRLVRFATLHPISKDQIHIEAHGLNAVRSALVGKWADRESLTSSQTSSLNFKYADLVAQSPETLEYISWHPEDPCFRLKLQNRSIDVKSPNQVDRFIDGALLSDLPGNYHVPGDPDEDAIRLPLEPNSIWILRYAISDHDLRDHPVLGPQIRSQLAHEQGKIIRWYVSLHSSQLSEEAVSGRPEGTILGFRFQEPGLLYSTKTFLVR